jgi:hypothetical protein
MDKDTDLCETCRMHGTDKNSLHNLLENIEDERPLR